MRVSDQHPINNFEQTNINFKQTPSLVTSDGKIESIGKLTIMDKIKNVFTPMEDRKVELHLQNQIIVMKIKDLSEATGIASTNIHIASQKKGGIDKLIQEKEAQNDLSVLSKDLENLGVSPDKIKGHIEKNEINLLIQLYENTIKDSGIPPSFVRRLSTEEDGDPNMIKQYLSSNMEISKSLIKLGVSPTVIGELYSRESSNPRYPLSFQSAMKNMFDNIKNSNIDPSLLKEATYLDQIEKMIKEGK